MGSFAEFNRTKLNLCTNLQKMHCIGEQICLVGMEHQNNAHHIRKIDFWICLRFGNNLPKMCSFAEFSRPKLDIYTNLQKKHNSGEQIFLVGMELLSNNHHIR